MGSRRAIYNDIAPKPRFFFVRGRKKFPRARPCPREFFCRGRKKSEVEVAISLYIARRDPIYIINIPLLLSLLKCGIITGSFDKLVMNYLEIYDVGDSNFSGLYF